MHSENYQKSDIIIVMYSTVDNVRDSLKLAWKYKILWVFALLVAAGGGGGGGGGGFEEGMFEDYEDTQYEYEVEPAESEALSFVNYNVEANVLGASNNSENQNQGGFYIEEWADSFSTIIALPFYILVPISLIVLIVYSIFVGLLVRGWALSALLAGTLKGAREERLNRKELADFGLKKMATFVKLDLRIMFYVFGIVLVVGVITALLAAIHETLFVITFFLILAAMIGIAFLALGMSFAYRHVIFQNVAGKEAIKMGISTFQKNWLDTVKLIVVAAITASIIVFAVIAAGLTIAGIVVGGFGLGVVATENFWLLIPAFIIGTPVLIAFVLGFEMVRGFTSLFKEFAWTKLFFHTQRIADLNTVSLNGKSAERDLNGTN